MQSPDRKPDVLFDGKAANYKMRSRETGPKGNRKERRADKANERKERKREPA